MDFCPAKSKTLFSARHVRRWWTSVRPVFCSRDMIGYMCKMFRGFVGITHRWRTNVFCQRIIVQNIKYVWLAKTLFQNNFFFTRLFSDKNLSSARGLREAKWKLVVVCHISDRDHMEKFQTMNMTHFREHLKNTNLLGKFPIVLPY
jgi:hypothetical protein